MPSMLDLPRELYLIVCSYLQPIDLTNLAGVSRDHYLAVQEPLYVNITISAYGRLVKLVDTIRRVPVVSTISPQQRLRWFKLTDAQLWERDIKALHIILDSRKDGPRITGAVIANCIGAVSRKCYQVKISLTLHGVWPKFISQLEKFGLPGVRKLTMFLLPAELDASGPTRSNTSPIWDLVFCGSSFPDMKSVYINTSTDDPAKLPTTLDRSITEAYPIYGSHSWKYKDDAPATTAVPFYGLRNMEEIVLAHNRHLTVDVMESFFDSDIIPQRLTRLEIVDCPNLHPVKHLNAIATLLQRVLQLVKHLKLHLCKLPQFDAGESFLHTQYAARIDEHPEEHPCNIDRELGQKIEHLDLALPFACSHIFPPAPKVSQALIGPLDSPPMSRYPVETLPARLMAAGYKYRRLICWHGVCRSAHAWQEMVDAAAGVQQGSVSWKMLDISPDLRPLS